MIVEEFKKAGSGRAIFLRLLCALLTVFIFPGVLAAQTNDLLSQVWNGIQQAQKKYASMCGIITETRTSDLMVKPLVLHGKFCAEGTTKFSLEYVEPSRMSIRFNENYLNVTSGGNTQVREIGKNVRRVQSYFGGENSLGNVKKNFTISVKQDGPDYQMKLVPRTNTFRDKLPSGGEAISRKNPAAIAGSEWQERCKQRFRHRRNLDESENSQGHV